LSETGTPFYQVFFEELRRLGYVEGRNLAVARYSAEGRNERHAEIAREVVRTKPDVVVTVGSGMVLSFKAASSTIPVVAMTGDPVALGVAASLARPGRNFTGSTRPGPEFYAKLLELLKEAIPTLSTVGIIAPPALGNPVVLAMQDAALRLGIQLIPGLLERYEEDDYRNLFGAIVQRKVDAILTSDQTENFTHRRLIIELAETNRLPTMSLYTANCGDRRPHRLCAGSQGAVPIPRLLCRQDPERGKSRRNPDLSGGQVRPRHQSQDCESARPRDPGVPRCPRRLGDRIALIFAAVHESGCGRYCCKSLFGVTNENS
jgi:hypothetical protein